MPVALHVNYHGTDFASTIVHAANLLGDADTTAAIAGQLAGAIYGYSGIDSRYVRALRVWDDGEVAAYIVMAHIVMAEGLERRRGGWLYS